MDQLIIMLIYLERNNSFQIFEPTLTPKTPRPNRRLLNVEPEVTKVTIDQSCHQCETHNPLRSESSQIAAVPYLEELVEEIESEYRKYFKTQTVFDFLYILLKII